METPLDRLQRLLDALERKVSPEREAEIESRYVRALGYEPVDRPPVIIAVPDAPAGDHTPYPHSQAVHDPAVMLFNELVQAWGTSIVRRSTVGDDLPLTVRANMGTVLVASCFGAVIEQPGDDPPWARHLDSRDRFVAALDRKGEPDSELVCRAERFMSFYREVLSGYGTLSRAVKITLPDLQGPLDNAAMLRGSDLLTDAFLDPPFFAAALDRMATAQIALAERFGPLTLNEPEDHVHQHGVMVRGGVLIRNDSTVMISPGMYAEQVGPHDRRVMQAVGGGSIHSCGSIDHVVGEYLAHPVLRSLDYGQSKMNAVDEHYLLARERRVALLRVEVDRDELVTGAVCRRFPTGVALLYNAESAEDARRTMQSYIASTGPEIVVR